MAVFVLVHGSWHGGWCWSKVCPLLRQAGHTVYTPTLTGLGERSHLLTRDVGLACHVRDVTQVLRYEDLREVILVGHSYAGMVISGVAEEAAERIRRLVYFDALIPTDGQSIFSLWGRDFEASFRAVAQRQGDGWLIPPMAPEALGVSNPEDVAWMRERLVPMPLATHADSVRMPSNRAGELPRSYIFCTQFGFAVEAEQARAEGWDYHELPTGHDAMVSAPQDFVRVLFACAK